MRIASLPRRALLAAAALSATLLTGCYVVPMQPTSPIHGPTGVIPAAAPAATASTIVVPAAPAAPLTFTARLYPANDIASVHGVLAATVTNDLNGRGRFSTAIGGESFVGEATRAAGSSKDGIANGAGSRGSYLTCRYTMNSPTLGTGSCRHSDGAQFSMHIGS
jgi:hypothetical protein